MKNGTGTCWKSTSALSFWLQSSFFMKLFTDRRDVTHGYEVNLSVSMSEGLGVLELLAYIYKGELSETCKSSTEACLQLLLAADKYGIETCVQACLEYLNETLPRAPEEDVVEIAKHLFLIQHVNNSTSVLENAKARLVAMVSKMFEKYGHSSLEELFLNFPLEVLVLVLRADKLRIDDEDTVCTAVLKWIRHNFADAVERRLAMDKVAPNLRLAFVSPDYIKNTLLVADECQGDGFRALVFQALLYKSGSTSIQQDLADLTAESRIWLSPRLLHNPPNPNAGNTIRVTTSEFYAGVSNSVSMYTPSGYYISTTVSKSAGAYSDLVISFT